MSFSKIPISISIILNQFFSALWFKTEKPNILFLFVLLEDILTKMLLTLINYLPTEDIQLQPNGKLVIFHHLSSK